jgi:23S rRNA pseudouridine2605 synthase
MITNISFVLYNRIMQQKEDLLGILIRSGIGSRRTLARAIFEGRIQVNGVKADSLRQAIDSRQDAITIDNRKIELQRESFVYLVLNKPLDVLTSVTDNRGRKTVTDFIPEKFRHQRLYPVGRLDINTSGLVLLTNDGEITNRLTHPKYGHEKEYLAVLDKSLTPEEVQKLEKGIELFDGLTAPARVKRSDDTSIIGYTIVIHEGRKRQVRRMFMALGRKVLRLKRIRMGNLTLGNLPEGAVREVSRTEIVKMLEIKRA